MRVTIVPCIVLVALTACEHVQPTSAPSVPVGAPLPVADGAATAQSKELYRFMGVEVFGTRKFTAPELTARFDFPQVGATIDAKDPELPQRLATVRDQLIGPDGPFAMCRINFDGMVVERTLVIILDIVDKGDEWRMKFTPSPTGHVTDTTGLIAAWNQYQRVYWPLLNQHKVKPPRESPCRFTFNCMGGFDHPDLAPFEARFARDVPLHREELANIVRQDSDQGQRAAAIFLLGYTEPEWVVPVVLPYVRDAQEGVRNEAMRALGQAQRVVRKQIVPLEVVLDSLLIPSASDRNKAGWALKYIVDLDGPAHTEEILDRAGEALLGMVGMKSPSDTEVAQLVLEKLSGEHFGTDRAKWTAWAERRLGRKLRPMAQ